MRGRPAKLVLTGALLLIVLSGCRRGPAVELHGEAGERVRVRVEVANTPDKRAQGLMYRNEIAADAGMLFLFPEEREHRFWMKNTLIPLDMLFIDGNRKIVGIVADARPLSTMPVGVEHPSRYVLEVNGGFASAHGVEVGWTVEFADVPEEIS
jgi:uncharacterized membrane protein (UPF0127 family)